MQAKVLANTKDLSRTEWHALRRQGIGGSDVAVIAGLNPWKSPVGLYFEKLGEYREEVDSEAAAWGLKLEEVVAQEFKGRIQEEIPGAKVWRKNAVLQHPEHECMIANIDRRIIVPEGENGILEVKTTSEYMRDAWDRDEVPDMYYLQLQHYLAVTGCLWGYFAVLIGGNKYRQFRIERDEEIIEQIVRLEKNFWRLVETGTPPEPDGTDATRDLLKALYPESEPEKIVRLPIEARELIDRYQRAREREKQAREEKREAQHKLCDLMEDAEQGLVDENKVYWKTVTKEELDRKALRDEQPEIYEAYCRTKSYRWFRIY